MKLLAIAAIIGAATAMPQFMTSVPSGELDGAKVITQKVCRDKACDSSCQSTPIPVGKCERSMVGSFVMTCSADGKTFNQTQYSDSSCKTLKTSVPGNTDQCYQAGMGMYVEFSCGGGSAAPLKRNYNPPQVIATVITEENGHYGDPMSGSCMSDEVRIEILGVSGAVCAPSCSSGHKCPSDLPSGVTAKPMCALQDSSTGNKYCALICSPSLPIVDLQAANDMCGQKASCKPISGVGLCTYDS